MSDMSILLIECHARRASDGAAQTLRLASGGVRADYFGVQWLPALIELPVMGARLGFDGRSFTAPVTSTVGGFSFSRNFKGLEGAQDLIWKGADITIWQGTPDDLSVIWQGRAQGSSARDAAIVVDLADPAEEMAKPLVDQRFAGTGGLEGGEDVEGRLKPRAWGLCENIPAILIDAPNNIWLLVDGPSTVHDVRDGGVAYIGPRVNVADYAALAAQQIPSGGVGVCEALSLVKPWRVPRFTLTANITAGTVGTAAEIAEAMLSERTSLAFAPGVVAGFVQQPSVSSYVADERTLAQEFDRLFGGLGSFWRFNSQGEIELGLIDFAAPTLTFDKGVVSVTRMRTIMPTYRRVLTYRPNYRALSDGELAQGVDEADLGPGAYASSLFELDAAQALKLDGVEAGATVGAVWGANVVGQPSSLLDLNFSDGAQLQTLLRRTVPSGMHVGGFGDVRFIKNTNRNGVANYGEIYVRGTSYYHPDGTKRTITDQLEISTAYESGIGSGLEGVFYIIYTDTPPATRFGGSEWYVAKDFFPATYDWENDQWTARDNNHVAYPFTPQGSDAIVAVGFRDKDVSVGITSISSLLGTNVNLPEDGATVGATSLQVAQINQALSDAENARAVADGKIVTFAQATQPTGQAEGDLWIDTDDGNKLYRWDNSAWVMLQDTAIGDAIAMASDAFERADSKIVTFSSETAPVAEGEGDLWQKPSTRQLYRWNGSSWDAITAAGVQDGAEVNRPSQNLLGSDAGQVYTGTGFIHIYLNRVALDGLALDPGDVISASLDVRYEGPPANCSIIVQFFDDNQIRIGSEYSNYLTTATYARSKAQNITIPANAVYVTVFAYGDSSGTVAGDMLFIRRAMLNRGPRALDYEEPPVRISYGEVELGAQVNPTPSMALNKGWETDDLTKWYVNYENTVPLDASYTTTSVASIDGIGPIAIRVEANAIKDTYSDPIPIDPTKHYKVSVYARHPFGDRRNYLLVNFLRSDLTSINAGIDSNATGWTSKGNYHYWRIVNEPFSTNFTKYEFVFGPNGEGTIPDAPGHTAAYAQIGLLGLRNGTTNTRIELQGYRLEEVADALTLVNGPAEAGAQVNGAGTIALLINSNIGGGFNPGEASLVGIKDGAPNLSIDGFINWYGTKITIERDQTVGFTILTNAPSQNGFIVFDTSKSQPFFIQSSAPANVNAAFVRKSGTQWQYDNNTSWVNFTPSSAIAALGWLQTGASDQIVAGGLFGQPVPLELAVFPSADVTGDNTAMAVMGQGAGATANSLMEMNPGEGTKLAGIQAGATVGARAGLNLLDGQGVQLFDWDVRNNIDQSIRTPGGGVLTGTTSVQTGALKIRLPQSWTNTMMKFTVDIFEYTAGYSCTLEIAGYNYSGGAGRWINVTARVIGGSNVEYPVYFGHDGTKCCVWIGGASETWSYPQVRVRDVLLGYSNTTRALWDTGWQISFDTGGAQNVTAQVDDTYPAADWRKVTGPGRPENGATVGADWGTNVTNIPYDQVISNADDVALGFNPTFSKWTGDYPDGWSNWAGTPPGKETNVVRAGQYAALFGSTGSDRGMSRLYDFGSQPLPAGTFLGGSLDIRMQSRTSGLPGILVRLYTNDALTTYIDNPVQPPSTATGVWQRIPWTARANGQPIYGIRIYVMASWSGLPSGSFTGTVIFDNIRFALFDSSTDNTTIQLTNDGKLMNGGTMQGNVSLGGLGAGALATLSQIQWASHILGRPSELTDGRIAAGLDASGDLRRNVKQAIADASNLLRYTGGGLFTGDMDAQRNNRITIDGSGYLQGIGTASKRVDNAMLTITNDGKLMNGGTMQGSVSITGLGGGALATMNTLDYDSYVVGNKPLSERATSLALAVDDDNIWIRVATISGTAGRGSYVLTLFGTGGGLSPSTTTLDVTFDWGSTANVTLISKSRNMGWLQRIRASYDSSSQISYLDIKVGSISTSTLFARVAQRWGNSVALPMTKNVSATPVGTLHFDCDITSVQCGSISDAGENLVYTSGETWLNGNRALRTDGLAENVANVGTMPAETVAQRATQVFTAFDSSTNLRDTVMQLQQGGGIVRRLTQSLAVGSGIHGDSFTFSPARSEIPVIRPFDGGKAVPNPSGSIHGTYYERRVRAINATTSGFTLEAVFATQQSTPSAITDTGAINESGAFRIEKSSASEAVDQRYTARYRVSIPRAFIDGEGFPEPTSVTVQLDTRHTSSQSWVNRASRTHYNFNTSGSITASGEMVAQVSGLGSAAAFRVRVSATYPSYLAGSIVAFDSVNYNIPSGSTEITETTTPAGSRPITFEVLGGEETSVQ